MMTFESFKEFLKENIKKYLPEEFKSAEVTFQKVIKNNNMELDSVLIKREQDTVVPSLYINSRYEDYVNGDSIEQILGKLSEQYVQALHNSPLNVLPDAKVMKNDIVIQLINKKMNDELLKEVPHKIENDLAVVCRWIVKKEKDGIGSVLIKNSMMEQLDITEEELFHLAKENTLRLFPPKVCSMQEALMGITEYLPISEFEIKEMNTDFPMYIVSNDSGINGAASILYPDVLEQLSEKLGGNMYLLPSSTHEMIAVPINIGMSVPQLENLVQSVNQDVVSSDEILSDHVYLYDKEKKCVINASEKVRDMNKEFVNQFLSPESGNDFDYNMEP